VIEITVLGPDGHSPGSESLTVVNDAEYPAWLDMALVGTRVLVVDQNGDRSAEAGAGLGPLGDGPTAIAAWGDKAVAVHAWDDRLYVDEQPLVSVGRYASDVIVSGSMAWVSERVGDTVQQVDLQRGKVLGRWEVGAVHVLEPGRAVVARHVPPSGLPIIGGPTAKMSRWIMGGREVRAMAWSSRHKRVFVASTRPNIGPNPRRWEVSMNGGISVVDPVDGYERHVSIRRGSDETAATAILGGALPEPRPGQALLRPLAELGKGRRNPASLHSGPAALALSPDGATLYALLRFSHQVVEYDTSGARDGTLIERRRHDLSPLPAQAERHLGEVAYVFCSRRASRCGSTAAHP
jgi:DNA-binding beta-propeller fold protein YncE